MTPVGAKQSSPRPPRHRQEAAPAEAAARTAAVPVEAGAVVPVAEALEAEVPAEEEPNCPIAVMKKSATSA